MKGFQRTLLATIMMAITVAAFAFLHSEEQKEESSLVAKTGSPQKLKSDPITQNGKIGVVDAEKLLDESEIVKEYSDTTIKNYQPKLDALAKQRDLIAVEEEQLKKDAITFSKSELEKKEAALNAKRNKLLQELKTLREEKEENDQQMYAHLQPKLEAAINRVAEKEHYSLILNKHATFYHASKIDITQKVMREFNRINKEDKAKKGKEKAKEAATGKPKSANQPEKQNP